MRIIGQVLSAGRPVEGYVVTLLDIGDDGLDDDVRRERRIGRSVASKDGSYELSFDGVAAETMVVLVVSERGTKEVLLVTKPMRVADLPDALDLDVAARPWDDDAFERDEPTPTKWDAHDRDRPPEPAQRVPEPGRTRSRVIGQISGVGQRPRTVELRVKTSERIRTVASGAVDRRGLFQIGVDHVVRKLGDGVTATLTVLAASRGDGTAVLHEQTVELVDGGDVVVVVELGEARPRRPPRPRPERPTDPADAGVLAERFEAGRIAGEAFRDRLIRDPYMHIRDGEAAAVDQAKAVRERIRLGERDERFVPTRLRQEQREQNPRFVESTLPAADRDRGRYIAQLDAVDAGLRRLDRANRGRLRYRLDPQLLRGIEGSRDDGERFQLDAGRLFGLMQHRIPLAPQRRVVPETLVDRLKRCIKTKEVDDE